MGIGARGRQRHRETETETKTKIFPTTLSQKGPRDRKYAMGKHLKELFLLLTIPRKYSLSRIF